MGEVGGGGGGSHTWSLVSQKAVRELNALGALHVYHVFEDEKSKG